MNHKICAGILIIIGAQCPAPLDLRLDPYRQLDINMDEIVAIGNLKCMNLAK